MAVLVAGGTGFLGTRRGARADRRRATTWRPPGWSRRERERLASRAGRAGRRPTCSTRTPPRRRSPRWTTSRRSSTWSAASPTAPRVHETDPAEFERLHPAQPDARLPARARGDAAADRARRRRVRGRVGAHGAAALPGRGRLRHRRRPRCSRLIQALDAEYRERRRPLQRDPAERDRHAGQPRVAARRRPLEVGGSRRRSPRWCASSSRTTRRRRAAPPCPSTGAP